MVFDWTKYLELAEYITKNSNEFPDKEACYRASVSRAYYAAYRTTCVYLSKTDKGKFKDGGSHQDVQNYLRKGNKLRRTISNQLKALHFDRKKADYHDEIRDRSPSYLSGKSIKTAKKIISKIEDL